MDIDQILDILIFFKKKKIKLSICNKKNAFKYFLFFSIIEIWETYL